MWWRRPIDDQELDPVRQPPEHIDNTDNLILSHEVRDLHLHMSSFLCILRRRASMDNAGGCSRPQ